MAHLNKVVRSINDATQSLCVDIVRAPDGRFGFNQYRRDPEDGRGWYQVGAQGQPVFDSAEKALDSAIAAVGWLPSALV
jgi:hypothetical protein